MAQQLPSPSSKYPFVGPNYIKFGEKPGYGYNPYQDKYYPDPQTVAKLSGEKEAPGLLEQLAPIAAGAGALEAGKYVGGNIPGIFSGAKDALGGLMGLGGGAGTAGTTVAPLAAGQASAGAGLGSLGTAMPTVGAAPAGTGMLSGLGAFALPAAAALATGYIGKNAYDAYKSQDWKSELTNPLNWLVGGGIGGPIPALGGLLGKAFGSGKDEDQVRRDAVRGDLQSKGLLDENWALDLGAGQKFDIGKDGKNDLYNVDLSSPLSQENLKTIAPLAHIITAGDKKLGSDFAGYFTNAIQSAQDPFAAAKQMYQNFGVTNREQARAELNKLAADGKLTREEVQVYDQGLVNVFPNDDEKKK